MPDNQLIFTDNPGELPAYYQLPPGLSIRVSSVVALIDGAAASGTFVPCLSIYSQDNKLMARVRPDQQFSAGDSGTVTWAPFLRMTTAATPVGSALPWARRNRTTDQSIASGSDVPVTWDTSVNDYASNFNFATLSGFQAIRVLQDGLYNWLCRIVGHTLATEFIIDLNPYDAGGVQTELFSYTVGVSTMAIANRLEGYAELTLRMPANSYMGVQIRHAAGAAKTIGDGTYLEVRRLGDSTVTGRGW